LIPPNLSFLVLESDDKLKVIEKKKEKK